MPEMSGRLGTSTQDIGVINVVFATQLQRKHYTSLKKKGKLLKKAPNLNAAIFQMKKKNYSDFKLNISIFLP